MPLIFLLVLAGGGAIARAQNPTSATNPYYGSVTVEPVTGTPL